MLPYFKILARTGYRRQVHSADPGEGRGQRWLDYDWVSRYEFGRTALRCSLPEFDDVREEIKQHPEVQARIVAEARRVQERWKFWKTEHKGELIRPGNWHGSTTRQIARQVGWELSYELVYSQTSLLTHTSVRAANDYLVETGVDDATRLNAAPSENYVERVVANAAGYLHAIAADWCVLLQVSQTMRDELTEVEGEWPK